jgi:hypothetical protein
VGELVAGQPGIALRSSDGVRPLKARAHEHFVPRLGMGMTPQP